MEAIVGLRIMIALSGDLPVLIGHSGGSHVAHIVGLLAPQMLDALIHGYPFVAASPVTG